MTCKFTWKILFKKLLPYAQNGSNVGFGIGEVTFKKKQGCQLLVWSEFLKKLIVVIGIQLMNILNSFQLYAFWMSR